MIFALTSMFRGLKLILAGKTGSGNSSQIIAGRREPSVFLSVIQTWAWNADVDELYLSDEAPAITLTFLRSINLMDAGEQVTECELAN